MLLFLMQVVVLSMLFSGSSWTHSRFLQIMAVLILVQLFEEPPGNSTDYQDDAPEYKEAFFT